MSSKVNWIKYIYFYNSFRLQKRFDNQAPLTIRQSAITTNDPIVYPIPENKKIKSFWDSIESKQSVQIQA